MAKKLKNDEFQVHWVALQVHIINMDGVLKDDAKVDINWSIPKASKKS